MEVPRTAPLRVWKPRRGGNVVAQEVSVVRDDSKYPEQETVVVSVRVPVMVSSVPAPWVVLGCERPPVGWTDLPWWRDGVALEPDFRGVSGPDVLIVGPGKSLPRFRKYAEWTDRMVELRCKMANPSPVLLREYKRRFGVACAPQLQPVAQLKVLDEPVASQIENAAGRVLVCKWETYSVPNLESVGFEGVSTPGDLGQLHSWMYTMVDKGSVKDVSVPAGLVDKLGEFWAFKEKDSGHANFLVSVEKLRNLLRPLVVTAHQSRVAMMYVPVIAYKRYLVSQNGLARLVSGSYVSQTTWRSVLALGAATLACLPTTASAAAIGVTSGATLLTGGAVTALVAGSAYLYLAARERRGRSYARVYPTTNCTSVPPKDWNRTASVTRSEVPSVQEDKVKDVVKVVGLASVDYLPEVFADNVENQYKALEKRVLAAPPEHDPEVVGRFIKWAKDNCEKILGKPVAIQSIEFDSWLENMNASRAVKARILKAKMALRDAGIDEHSVLAKDQIHKATQREAFTKFETVLSGSKIAKSEKASRLIQGAHPEMTALVGPWMSAFQGRMKKVLDGRGGLMFTSGKTVRQVAEFIGSKIQDGWSPFDDDVGAYDLSLIVPYAEFEVWLCDRYHCPRTTHDLMTANIETHGWTSLGWKYSVRGTRKSGDTFTSVMNSILNLMFHLFIFCEERQIGVSEALKSLVMAAQGDDDVGAHVGPKIDWKAGMAKLGFKSEPHYVESVSKLEFCSHYLTKDSVGWTFFPKVGRILAKAGVSLRAPDGLEAAYARSTILSLRGACASCPPLRAYCDRVMQLTEGERLVPVLDEPWKMRSDIEGEPTPETWLDLHERYGYSIGMHKQFEVELREMELGSPANHPIFNHLCSVDSDVPGDLNIGPLGRKVELKECGPDAELDYVQYEVRLPGDEATVIVDVKDGNQQSSVLDVVRLACNKVGRPKINAADAEFLVAGKPVHHATCPLGIGIEVRYRGRGGMLSVVAGLSKPGVWLAQLLLETTVEVGAEKFAFSEVDEKKESRQEYVWIDSNPATVMMVKDGLEVGIPNHQQELATVGAIEVTRDVVVDLCGRTKVVTMSVSSSVIDAVGVAFGLSVVQACKFQPHLGGKPTRWTVPLGTDGDVVVRARLVGGAQVSRGEKILKRIEDNMGVKATSRPWLLSAIDPMHDNSIGLGSYPDMNGAMSVPMLVRNTMQVATNQGSTANWDCNIVFNPEACLNALSTVTRLQSGNSLGASSLANVFTSPAGGQANGGTYGGISAYKAASGSNMDFTSWSQGISYVPSATTGAFSSCAIDGAWRMTSLGLEITNTTAELYKQGTVTVWTQPVPPPWTGSTYNTVDFSKMPSTTGWTPVPFSGVLTPAFPYSVAEANILGGSRQWNASEGAYMVARRSSDVLPILGGQCQYPVYYHDNSQDQTVVVPTWFTQTLDGGAISYPTLPQSSLTPFNMMGALFTGLSAQSTLTVNVWAYLEVFPEQVENVLTPLAQPSAPYDEQALRLYAEIIKAMPVGVMFKENGLGDWFMDAANSVVDTIGSVASTVGRVVGGVGSFVSSWNGSKPNVSVIGDIAGKVERKVRSEIEQAKNAQGGSSVLRGDGVKEALKAERKILRTEGGAASTKYRLMARQLIAADKAKARLQATLAKKRK